MWKRQKSHVKFFSYVKSERNVTVITQLTYVSDVSHWYVKFMLAFYFITILLGDPHKNKINLHTPLMLFLTKQGFPAICHLNDFAWLENCKPAIICRVASDVDVKSAIFKFFTSKVNVKFCLRQNVISHRILTYVSFWINSTGDVPITECIYGRIKGFPLSSR